MDEILAHVIVGGTSSKCSFCRRGADPTALAHDTIVEYGPDTGKPGCGATFLWCTSTYVSTAWLEGQKHRFRHRSRSGL